MEQPRNKTPKKQGALFYVGGSALLVVATVAITALINRTKPSDSTDIRARAAALNTLKLTGTIATVAPSSGAFTVTNLKFHNQSGESIETSLGTWTITIPPAFNPSSLVPGKNVLVTADASTFLIQAHTLTATSIVVR